MTEIHDWNERYRQRETPWDTGRPSAELARVVAEEKLAPCRAIELGCGTGSNTVWLASQGFDVTGVDVSALAIERARQRAVGAGVRVRFVEADLLDAPELGGPFQFFFDRGCYHAVRRVDVARFLKTLGKIVPAGAQGLVLAGNAREPHDPGPPVVSEEEIRRELGSIFEIVRLREFRFEITAPGFPEFLAWSCLVRKK
jgi:SAM-dependent methyltransferase